MLPPTATIRQAVCLLLLISLSRASPTGDIGYNIIHTYLCTGNNNWADSIKDRTLRPILKVGVRLVCGDKTDILGEASSALAEFYNSYPEEEVQQLNTCLIGGILKQMDQVICLGDSPKFLASAGRLVKGVFGCSEAPDSALCKVLTLTLNATKSLVEAQQESYCKSKGYAIAQQLSNPRYIMKRQYDVINMIKLVEHLSCHNDYFVTFATLYIEASEYGFSGEEDEFLFDFLMRIASKFICCLMGSAVQGKLEV